LTTKASSRTNNEIVTGLGGDLPDIENVDELPPIVAALIKEQGDLDLAEHLDRLLLAAILEVETNGNTSARVFVYTLQCTEEEEIRLGRAIELQWWVSTGFPWSRMYPDAQLWLPLITTGVTDGQVPEIRAFYDRNGKFGFIQVGFA
jgi:hypothetical protein